MSKLVSALPGARFEGIATIHEAGLVGMVTLRGDFANKTFRDCVESVSGCAFPEVRKISFGEKGRALAWMSPDELLFLTDHAEANLAVDAFETGFGNVHAMAVNVSDARAVFALQGAAAREVIAKVAPVDMQQDAFDVGDFRRTRFAQTPAALWMEQDGGFRIVCFRSVAQYMFDLLCVAAQPGSEVGVY